MPVYIFFLTHVYGVALRSIRLTQKWGWAQESSSLENAGLWMFYRVPDYIKLLFKTILSVFHK